MKKILILDANQRSALAVARSLGKRGVPVCTAEDSPNALASTSRFSLQHYTYPSPSHYPEQFIESLCEIVAQLRVDILLPMTELTTTLLLLHREKFSNTVFPFPNLATVDFLADKCQLMKFAETIGIPIPQTWYADEAKHIHCDLSRLEYPIVLKPGKSWLYHDGKWARASVLFAYDVAEAKHLIQSYWAFQSHPFLIQEWIEGQGEGVFAIYDQGNPLALFAHRRLREKPPSGGVSVLSESIPVEIKRGRYAQALLGKSGWHGVAMVEFKVASNGIPYLMEVNTRFWGSLQLAVDSGVDFPFLLYKLAIGDRPESVVNYHIGSRLRWILGDLDSLYLTIKDKKIPIIQKVLACLKFMTPSPTKTRHEINRFGDLNPFWFELKQYLNNIIKK